MEVGKMIRGKSMLLSLVLLAFAISLSASICFADVSAQLQEAAGYREQGYYKQAEDAYKAIIQNNPGTDYAFKARQRLAILYIVTERANAATEQINAMNAEFAGHADLPEALYWIAKRYRVEGHADRAKSIYQQIISQYPDSAYAKKVQLDVPRTNVLSLLSSGKYAEAETAIDKLINDFSGHPELPETLYDIARACKTSGRYAKAKSLYQYILQKYPSCSYVEFCPVQIKKMDIWSMIASGNFTGAHAATDKLITDFAIYPELPDTLHGIALRYEEKGVNRFQDSQNLYQRIIKLYPESNAAKKAVLDIEKSRALALMESGNDDGVLSAVNAMLAKFSNQRTYLSHVISREIAMQYYRKGLQADPNHAGSSLRNATAIWDKVINQLNGPDVTAEACCYAGDSYLKLGEYKKALSCYQKVIKGYPMCRFNSRALAMAGHTYEVMKQSKLISAAEADTQIKVFYRQLVDTYSESKDAEHAKKWLGVL